MILAAQVHFIDDQRRSLPFQDVLNALHTGFQDLRLTAVEFLSQFGDLSLALGRYVDDVRSTGLSLLRLRTYELGDRLTNHVR